MDLQSLWSDMESEIASARTTRVFRRLVPESEQDIFASINVGGIPVQKVRAIELELPSSVVELVDQPSGTKQVACDAVSRTSGATSLVFVLAEDGSQELFAAMAADIVRASAPCDDPFTAASTWCGRFEKWRRMFEGKGRGLSPRRQMGLANELLTLVEQLMPVVGIEDAVSAWIGPQGSPRDFEVSAFGVETKASGSNEPQVVDISNERQLDDSELKGLALVHRSFEIVRGGEQTLPSLVERVRQLVDGTVAMGALEERLIEAGYADANNSLYEATGFETRRLRIFRVQDGFPRIVERELIDGVGSVSYRLVIAACQEFEIEPEDWARTLESAIE